MALAEKCGTSTAYIGQIEIGNRFPSLDMVEKIADALQIKPFLLFLEESNDIINEKKINTYKESISDLTKDKLIQDITMAVQKIIKRVK